MESILTEKEFRKIDDIDSKLDDSAMASLRQNVTQLLHLSIVPTFDGKIRVVDETKDMKLDLRALPPFELYLALPKSYPSH